MNKNIIIDGVYDDDDLYDAFETIQEDLWEYINTTQDERNYFRITIDKITEEEYLEKSND